MTHAFPHIKFEASCGLVQATAAALEQGAAIGRFKHTVSAIAGGQSAADDGTTRRARAAESEA